MRATYSLVAVAVATLIVWTSGCAPQGTAETMVEISGPPPGMPVGGHGHDDDHAGHNHAAEHQGPHGGHVIELGRNHEFHAELVEDDATRRLVVYVLDKDLKEFPIDQPSIAMNLIVGGTPQTFLLAAESSNRSSRFSTSESDLYVALHEQEARGKLRLTINGTPYTGNVEHHDHHDKDGHSHGEDGVHDH